MKLYEAILAVHTVSEKGGRIRGRFKYYRTPAHYSNGVWTSSRKNLAYIKNGMWKAVKDCDLTIEFKKNYHNIIEYLHVKRE